MKMEARIKLMRLCYQTIAVKINKYQKIVEQINNAMDVDTSKGPGHNLCIDISNNTVAGDQFGIRQIYFSVITRP